MIPDAGRNDTVVPGDTRHLCQSLVRIRHEMDNELRDGRVERQGRKRQSVCGRLQYLDAGVALPSSGDEGVRGVDGRNSRRPHARDQLRREGPGTAANVEHPLAGSHPGEVRQLRRKEERVLAHVAVVGVRGHIEAHLPNLLCRAPRL